MGIFHCSWPEGNSHKIKFSKCLKCFVTQKIIPKIIPKSVLRFPGARSVLREFVYSLPSAKSHKRSRLLRPKQNVESTLQGKRLVVGILKAIAVQDAIERKMQPGGSNPPCLKCCSLLKPIGRDTDSSLDMNAHLRLTGRWLEAVAVGKCSKLSHGKDWKLVSWCGKCRDWGQRFESSHCSAGSLYISMQSINDHVGGRTFSPICHAGGSSEPLGHGDKQLDSHLVEKNDIVVFFFQLFAFAKSLGASAFQCQLLFRRENLGHYTCSGWGCQTSTVADRRSAHAVWGHGVVYCFGGVFAVDVCACWMQWLTDSHFFFVFS